MAILYGSITMSSKSTLTAKGNIIASGATTLGATSLLTSKGNVITSGSVRLKGSSVLSTFWLELKASSKLILGEPIIRRVGSVSMSATSTLVGDLIKAGKEFVRKAFIEGDIIRSTTLEGGGGLYMKTNQDIQLTSGDYFEVNVKVFDENGTPKDISGFTFHWVLGKLTKTNGEGVTITNPTGGELTVILYEEDTAKLYGDYTHTIRMTDAQSHSTTILKGSVRVNK
jgi:hypothetical protein